MTESPRTSSLRAWACWTWFCCCSILATTPVGADLQITELMINPLLDDSTMWEWIEVRNTSSTPIDLHGYLVNKRDFDQEDAITISNAASAVVPGNGVAVLYDGAADGADDGLFRSAWGLGSATRLIAVPNLPALSNSGANRNIGFWADQGAYSSDWVDDGEGGFDVGDFSHAAFAIDYAAEGFPGVASGVSNAWDGAGSYANGANWGRSEENVAGAVVSTQVLRPPTPINNVEDVGSPGVVPLGVAAAGLLITEIMYNPASQDSAWEWIEIFNNTGAAIDFGATPYVLDDLSGGDLDEPNIAAGVVADGEAAVLFDADALTPQNFLDAWDADDGNELNLIEVARWPTLNNTGDEIGLWSGVADYLDDSVGDDRTVSSAATSAAYESGGEWPSDDGFGSVFLSGLAEDPSVGTSWELSVADSGSAWSASQALETIEAHPGGEIGSPGVFGDEQPTGPADFNQDRSVNAADLFIWEAAFGAAATAETGDATGDALATGDDLLAWQRQFTGNGGGLAAPEPTGFASTLLLAASTIALWRRTAEGT